MATPAPQPASAPWMPRTRRERAPLYLLLALSCIPAVSLAMVPFQGSERDSWRWWQFALYYIVLLSVPLFYLLAARLYLLRAPEARGSAARLVMRVAAYLKREAHKTAPGLSLGTGSLLVLISLGLAVSQTACSKVIGLEVLRGQGDWIGAYAMGTLSFAGGVAAWLGRLQYGAGLLLAGVTLVCFTVLRRHRMTPRLRRAMRFTSALLTLYVISDAAFAFILYELSPSGFRPVLFALWLIYWLLPPLLWLRLGRSSSPQRRARWPWWRNALVMGYLPLLLQALMQLISFHTGVLNLSGLFSYLVGVGLLWLGYALPARAAAAS